VGLEIYGRLPGTVNSCYLKDFIDELSIPQFILPMHDFTDCSFIAEDKLLLSGRVDGVMEINSIADKSKPPQCTARFSLPSLMEDWLYLVVTPSINPRPGSVFLDFQNSSHRPSCFFHPSLDDQLMSFHIIISDTSKFCDSERDFFFFARQGAILRLESLFAKQASTNECFPWSSWRPQNTTWFLGDCRQSLYGFRTVGFIDHSRSLEPRRLCIRDFNPHNICDYSARCETGRHGRLVQGGTTTTMNPFTEPLGSALPYREIISEELQVDASKTIMDNSRVLLLKASHNLCFGPSAYDGL
jgi:hypothetical protein